MRKVDEVKINIKISRTKNSHKLFKILFIGGFSARGGGSRGGGGSKSGGGGFSSWFSSGSKPAPAPARPLPSYTYSAPAPSYNIPSHTNNAPSYGWNVNRGIHAHTCTIHDQLLYESSQYTYQIVVTHKHDTFDPLFLFSLYLCSELVYSFV